MFQRKCAFVLYVKFTNTISTDVGIGSRANLRDLFQLANEMW